MQQTSLETCFFGNERDRQHDQCDSNLHLLWISDEADLQLCGQHLLWISDEADLQLKLISPYQVLAPSWSNMLWMKACKSNPALEACAGSRGKCLSVLLLSSKRLQTVTKSLVYRPKPPTTQGVSKRKKKTIKIMILVSKN